MDKDKLEIHIIFDNIENLYGCFVVLFKFLYPRSFWFLIIKKIKNKEHFSIFFKKILPFIQSIPKKSLDTR